jgi:hypothetical protein
MIGRFVVLGHTISVPSTNFYTLLTSKMFIIVNHYKPAIGLPIPYKMYYLKIYYIKNIWEGMEVELSLA